MSKKKINANNKVILVLIGILLVCFIVLGLVFYKYFYAGSSSSKYGERLSEIEKHKLSSTLEKDIIGLYTDDEYYSKAEVNVKGKVIYINIEFKGSLTTSDAEDKATRSLEPIGEDNLAYYDVQYILTLLSEEKEEESEEEENYNNFPVFGAKSANSNKIVWSK